MSVKFTQEAEQERLANRETPQWGLYSSPSIVSAIKWAQLAGWKEKKVQVRFEMVGSDVVQYTVEPYEEGCSCRGLLKYEDYFN